MLQEQCYIIFSKTCVTQPFAACCHFNVIFNSLLVNVAFVARTIFWHLFYCNTNYFADGFSPV
jgi:hypothetical protein